MNKDFFRTFFSAGVPFGIIMGLILGIFNGPYGGIFSGIIAGLFFGTWISVFVQIQRKKFKKISADITDGKMVIVDGAANHFKGVEAVGGWLYLTTEEIIFKSHAFNAQKHQTTIPLKQIVEAKTVSTLGFIPNGLQILTSNGTIERFVVNNRKSWIIKINNAISSLKN